jgi:hypothetical protein
MHILYIQDGEEGSVYSLHGAYDTDHVPEEILGSVDDPLTPMGVSAMMPSAAGPMQALMEQVMALSPVWKLLFT